MKCYFSVVRFELTDEMTVSFMYINMCVCVCVYVYKEFAM